MKINPNSPAFPIGDSCDTGLTVRAEFAKVAMAGILADCDFSEMRAEEIAESAVKHADALIARLNQDEK